MAGKTGRYSDTHSQIPSQMEDSFRSEVKGKKHKAQPLGLYQMIF